MIRSQLLSMIQCPITGEPVEVVTQSCVEMLNEEIEQGRLFNQLGVQVESKLDGGLVNKSATCLIMIRNGIPELSPDQIIPIDHLEFFEPNQESAEIRTYE